MKDRARKRNQVLRALAGSTWGASKEILSNTYKAIGRSIFNYGAAVWSPALSKTSWDDLQAVQNGALRTITGATKMSQISHLHNETKILKVRDHNNLLCKQFLAQMHKQKHPNHHQLAIPPPPPGREMGATLKDKYIQEIGHISINEDSNMKAVLKQIHTETVHQALDLLEDNKVLGAAPPKISEEEQSLSRRARTYLSQLRSGYSPLLQSYLHRLKPTEDQNCPKCGTEPHTTLHLFNCPLDPTDLSPEDLWTRPVETARFLKLDSREEDDNLDPG